jgi:predicted amidohydrolase YtcJ
MAKLFYNARPVLLAGEANFDAFLVEDGLITATGEEKALLKSVDGVCDTVDLGGHPLIYGLTDSHLHLLAYAATLEKVVNLKGVRSLDELQNRVKTFIEQKNVPTGSWVAGSGWNHDQFAERRMPDRHDLDCIAVDKPIKLVRMCFHASVVNTMALQMAGIDKDTPDPPGGAIDRDQHGYPTGLLRETAMDLVDRAIPPISDQAVIKDLILTACDNLVRLGFTTVHVDDFSFNVERRVLFDAYLDLDRQGLLPLDVVLQLIVQNEEELDFYIQKELKSGLRYSRLMIGPIKVLADGSLGSRTAALKEPYSDDPQTAGFLLMPVEKLDRLFARALENGFDLAVHAIGDLAMEKVAGLLAKHQELRVINRLTASIIHCTVADYPTINLLRHSDIIANIQPIFIHSDWQIAPDRLGTQRLKTSYCWKTYLSQKVFCVGSSDAPIESANPFENIYAAVARKDLNGKPDAGWIKEEALSREDALRLFTLNPPVLSREAEIKGQLKTGFRADFVLLSADPLLCSEEALKAIKVIKTYKSGVPVNLTG